jgi:hypothetical protein
MVCWETERIQPALSVGQSPHYMRKNVGQAPTEEQARQKCVGRLPTSERNRKMSDEVRRRIGKGKSRASKHFETYESFLKHCYVQREPLILQKLLREKIWNFVREKWERWRCSVYINKFSRIYFTQVKIYPNIYIEQSLVLLKMLDRVKAR